MEKEYTVEQLVKIGIPFYEKLNVLCETEKSDPMQILIGCLLKIVAMTSGNKPITALEIENFVVALVGYRDSDN